MKTDLDYRVCKNCEAINEAKALSCSSCKEKMPELIDIVISYSHEDEDDIKKLKTHLTALKRANLVNIWYDNAILPGREWETNINDHFRTADVILLLITPNFMASDYCYGIEMQIAVERHKRREACVIPVVFRPTEWMDAPISRLQALPERGKPVVLWPDKDTALLNVTKGIKSAIIERYRPDEQKAN